MDNPEWAESRKLEMELEWEKLKRGEARERWVHEDILINHRLTWLGVTQGLLFGALGFAIHEKSFNKNEAALGTMVKYLPWLGVSTSIFILLGVVAAMLAMRRIKENYGLPHLGVSNLTTRLGWLCGAGIPTFFAIAWLLVAFKIS